MSGMNSCCFSGRLGGDAVTRFTSGGKPVTNFSLALDVGWGDRKHTLWVVCNCWGQRFEKLAAHLTKGTSVVVAGEIDLREYDKNDGSKGVSLDLNVRDVSFHGSSEGGGQKRSGGGMQDDAGGGFRETAKPAAAPTQGSLGSGTTADNDFHDDDIPF